MKVVGVVLAVVVAIALVVAGVWFDVGYRATKQTLYLEALLAEAKLARYDRENPYEVGVDALSSLLDDLMDDDDAAGEVTVVNNIFHNGDAIPIDEASWTMGVRDDDDE